MQAALCFVPNGNTACLRYVTQQMLGAGPAALLHIPGIGAIGGIVGLQHTRL